MGSHLRVKETIALGEHDVRSFYEIIEAQATFGWMTFDQALLRACLEGLITEETAILYGTNKSKLTRMLDDANKRGGQQRGPSLDLRLDLPDGTPPPPQPPPTPASSNLPTGSMRLSS
jgi:twitching motility protein PilT